MKSRKHLVAVFVLALSIFALDYFTPNGIATGVLYVIPVAVAFGSPGKRHIFSTAVASSCLTILGALAGGDIVTTIPVVIANRVISLIGIWLTAIFAIQLKNREASLLRTQDELGSVNKELEAFCYSVSHDLRAPLRGADGFSQALLEDYSERLDDEGKKYLVRIRSACKRMGQLIDDLLKLSRVTREQMKREQINLTELANVVANELRKRDPERQVEFVIEDGLAVECDGRLLRVALENLFGNAWKFTRNKNSARIEFGMERQNGLSAYYVRDNGVGFDMAFREKLFGTFQRLHSAKEFEGEGIGLATVKRVIHKHGGLVWAHSEPEKATVFYFTLQ